MDLAQSWGLCSRDDDGNTRKQMERLRQENMDLGRALADERTYRNDMEQQLHRLKSLGQENGSTGNTEMEAMQRALAEERASRVFVEQQLEELRRRGPPGVQDVTRQITNAQNEAANAKVEAHRLQVLLDSANQQKGELEKKVQTLQEELKQARQTPASIVSPRSHIPGPVSSHPTAVTELPQAGISAAPPQVAASPRPPVVTAAPPSVASPPVQQEPPSQATRGGLEASPQTVIPSLRSMAPAKYPPQASPLLERDSLPVESPRMTGVGLLLGQYSKQPEKTGVYVMKIEPGSPADKCGLIKIEDLLRSIDGQEVNSWQDCKIIRGEIGTTVNLEFGRKEGATERRFNVTLRRGGSVGSASPSITTVPTSRANSGQKTVPISEDAADTGTSPSPSAGRHSPVKKITGVGILLGQFDAENSKRGFYILKMQPGGPAQSSGLLEINDYIFEVDNRDVSTKSLEEVLSMLRGAIGSQVTLAIGRKVGNSLQRKTVTLVRKEVVPTSSAAGSGSTARSLDLSKS